MKKYNTPNVVSYFGPTPIVPLAAIGAAVGGVAAALSTKAIESALAAGIAAGMAAGKRDIYHGRRASLVPCIE